MSEGVVINITPSSLQMEEKNMDTTTTDLAVLRAALEAEENLFAHTAACPHCTDLAVCSQAKQLWEHAEQLRRRALGHTAGRAELDDIMRTAEALVRDILQYVRAGRYDEDAQAAFTNWISEALLAQSTTQQIDQLGRAAGLVDTETMRARVEELHVTISRLMSEWSKCAAQWVALHEAAQVVVTRWEQGDLAHAVRNLAALLPPQEAV